MKSFLDGNYSEKNLVGMDNARGSLTLFERFLVFRVGQVNDKRNRKIKTELSNFMIKVKKEMCKTKI